MLIYLIRHGQTTGDVEDRYGGDYDDHLTELGKQQSALVAKKLAQAGIDVIYASPKIRAQETANILKTEIGVGLITVPDFRERNRYGVLSGLTKTEALEQYPDEVKLLSDERSTLEGAEDYESFGERIKSALESIDASEYKTVAVVTHGGPIRYVFRGILKKGEIGIGDCTFVKLKSENGKLGVLELDGIKLKT